MPSPRLLAFAGSLREDSFNRKLVRAFADAAREAGADVTLLDLREYPLPVYDGDIEARGMPDAVRSLQALLAEHDGLLISSPEYNGGVPALVKNTLDWVSRPQENGDSGVALYRGKVAGICAASPGGLGGMRGLIALRDLLAKLGLWVAPSQLAVAGAADAFDEQGRLKDEGQRKSLARLAGEAVTAARALRKT